MIPFWTLTMGQALSIIQKPLKIDYSYFIGHIFYLVFPLFLGFLISIPIRCCFSHFSKLIVIILRIFSPIYILCIIANAFLTNVDMFIPRMIPWLFSWKVKSIDKSSKTFKTKFKLLNFSTFWLEHF